LVDPEDLDLTEALVLKDPFNPRDMHFAERSRLTGYVVSRFEILKTTGLRLRGRGLRARPLRREVKPDKPRNGNRLA
jgi:hypothetical protein